VKVLVDTSVLSLALRRARPVSQHHEEIIRLLRSGNVALLGCIRQEVLSGIRDTSAFRRLRDQLRALPDHPVTTEHYETGAEFFNRCRARGIQGTFTDFLLCACAALDELPIYTTDQDFDLFARVLPIKLFETHSG
jgi:predicted nucleic acid-binding protein